jgi:thiol-disulfide isomerase/thioredoxin
MSLRWVFAGVAVLALLAGAALFLGSRAPSATSAGDIAPSALYAAGFRDPQGATHSLAQFRGRLLVVNFWATWCAPCREEMPAFTRLQARWSDRGVQFVGLARDEPAKVSRFGRDLGINYPLWVGEDEVDELSRRLGNRLGVLPYTVILDRQGRVLEKRVGPYTETALEGRLLEYSRNPP